MHTLPALGQHSVRCVCSQTLVRTPGPPPRQASACILASTGMSGVIKRQWRKESECTGTTSTGQERRRSNGSKQRAPRGDRWPPARRTPSRLERQEAGRRQDRRGAGGAQNQAWEFEKITSEHVTDLLDEQETFKQSRHRKPSEWETPSLFAPWVRGRWKGKSHAHRHAWSRCDYARG